MASSEIVEKIRAASDIVEVVGQWVPLKRAGANYKGLCPFHNEKSPSFNVHPGKQIFHCFGCNEGGDVFSFVAKINKSGFPEAMRYLAERAGIEIPTADPERREAEEKRRKEEEELLRLLELAASWFRRNLEEGSDASHARAYAEARGLDPATREKFQLGYAPADAQALIRAAAKKGVDEAGLEKAGLVIRSERGAYARFRGRLIFPILDARGRLAGFGGRVLGEGEPKYLNSPEGPLFSKGRLFYAWTQARDAVSKGRRALVAEGYLDAIACHQHGVDYAVATLGTALTEEHARQLKRYVDVVHLVFDADNAGVRAARKGCEVLLAAGLEPKVVELAPHKDPDEFLKALGRDAFNARVEGAASGLAFLVEAGARLRRKELGRDLDVSERAGLMKEAFPLLKLYGTAVEEKENLVRLSKQLNLDEAAIELDYAAFKSGRPGAPGQAEGKGRPALGGGEALRAGGEGGQARSASLAKVERELLRLLVAHPELVERAKAELPEPELASEELSAAARLLWAAPGGAALTLPDDGSEAYKLGEALLRELSMDEQGFGSDKELVLRKQLLRRQEERLKVMQRQIKDQLMMAPEGDAGRWLGEKQAVDKAIQEIRRELDAQLSTANANEDNA